eukprot:scaffold44743_cov22-Tisochrysis_lutea.AAC.1
MMIVSEWAMAEMLISTHACTHTHTHTNKQRLTHLFKREAGAPRRLRLRTCTSAETCKAPRSRKRGAPEPPWSHRNAAAGLGTGLVRRGDGAG